MRLRLEDDFRRLEGCGGLVVLIDAEIVVDVGVVDRDNVRRAFLHRLEFLFLPRAVPEAGSLRDAGRVRARCSIVSFRRRIGTIAIGSCRFELFGIDLGVCLPVVLQ